VRFLCIVKPGASSGDQVQKSLPFVTQALDMGTNLITGTMFAGNQLFADIIQLRTPRLSRLHFLLQSLTSAHRSTNEYYFVPSLPAPKPDIGTQEKKRILLHAFTSCSKALTLAHRSTNEYYFMPSLPAPKPDIRTQVNKQILLRAFTAFSKA